jgi:tellurite resistance protein TerA
MNLKQKGQDTLISLKDLTVNMNWNTAADFDLAVIYKTKENEKGIVYFGDLGHLEEFPHIQLDKDAGVGDATGSKQETLKIKHLNDMKYVWLFCWDYGMVKIGKTARFTGSDVSLSLIDREGNQNIVELDDAVEDGNVCCIATIDNTSPTGAMLINVSRSATLNKLETLNQLFDVVE